MTLRSIIDLSFRPPRCVIIGRIRLHHGLIGLALVWHDRRDWTHWLPDLIRRP